MTDKAWPTHNEVRQQLWDTTQKLYTRVGFLEGTLIYVQHHLKMCRNDPEAERLVNVINAALKEPK
jgi:hypothetical protein